MERVNSGRRTTTAIELTPAMDAIIKRITVHSMLPFSFVVFVFVVEVVIVFIYCGFGFCCRSCCKCFLLSSPTTLCLEWCCSTPMGSRSRAPLTTQAQCRWKNHLIVVPFQIQFHMFGSVALLYLFKYKCKYNTSTVQVEESSCCCTFSNTITCLDQLVAFAVWRYGDRADWKS